MPNWNGLASPSGDVCEECGIALEFDYHESAMVCPACGLVHRSLDGGFGETPALDASGVPVRHSDRRLGGLRDPGAPGARGYRGEHDGDAAAEVAVRAICRGLDCPDPWDALDMLRRAASGGWLRGFDPVTKAAACAYVALHSRGNPRCLSEVEEVCGYDGDRLARAVSRVRAGAGLGPLGPAEWRANTSRLTDRYCAKLGLPPATAACARRIVESECDRGCREMTKGSWSPSGFVAAVICVASARTGRRVTVRDVSEAVCIDVSTVGRHARGMRADHGREWP